MYSQQFGRLVFIVVGDMDSMEKRFSLHLFPQAFKKSRLEFGRSFPHGLQKDWKMVDMDRIALNRIKDPLQNIT